MTHIACARDTNNVRYGKYCLKISGFAGKQNACAARALLKCPRPADSSRRLLTFSVRGRGTLSFRARTAKSEKWTYYNTRRFEPSKSAKYCAYDFFRWTAVSVPIIGQAARAREIEFEIRVKKLTAIDLRIDNIEISAALLAVE
jgi:hypothetical protein